jgi:hypothetical protein
VATRISVALSAAALAAWVAAGASCAIGGSSSTAPEPEEAVAKPGAEGLLLGIAEPNAWRRASAPISARGIARKVDALGADSQRFVVDWSIVEPSPPSPARNYRFEAFDAMYRADLARGIRPLIVVLNAPAWAAEPGARPGSLANNPPAASRLRDWAAFVQTVAERYPRAVGIELWNEPNLKTFWGSGSPLPRPDPARYAALLEAGYTAVKSADPGMPVIGGAVSPTQAEANGDIPPTDFVRGLLESGAGEHMDALSLHPYPGTGGVAQTLALIDQVRSVRDELGGSETPLWLTEIGVTTSGPAATSEARQARDLARICAAVARAPDVDAVYLHNLVELPGSHASPEPGFGLLQPLPDGRLRTKPAFAAVRREFSEGCGS